MRRGNAEAFFAPTTRSEIILGERKRLIDSHPERYLVQERGSEKILSEVWNLGESWGQLNRSGEDGDSLAGLARQWEPDLLLMDQVTGKFAAAAVCFPSSWDPRHAVGKTVHEVHEIVPQLNPQIGKMIEQFLMKLKPGRAARRHNWGLTRSAEMNYHPSLKREKLDEEVTLEELYLRVEQQIFVGVPGAVLMGLRLDICPLSDLLLDQEEWNRCREKIRSMPEDVAEYKGLLAAREAILKAMH